MFARPRTAIYAAMSCLAGVIVTGVVAQAVPAAQVRDSASLRGFAALRDTTFSNALERIAHIADGGPYTLFAVALVLVALFRRRRRLAMVVGAVLVVAPVTTELLKHGLTLVRARDALEQSIAPASWPSGHATAAMTLALCGVLVAPARHRPLVAAIGGLFTVAVSYAVLVWVWHFPSDVVGGLLIAAFYALLAVAFLRRWPDPIHRTEPREAEPSGVWPAIALGAGTATAAVAVAVQRHSSIVEHVDGRSSFVVAAVVIAALAVGLAAVLALSARSG